MRIRISILQSLYSRFVLIIVAPTLLLSSAAYYAFFERHWDNISETLAKSIAQEVYIISNANRLDDSLGGEELATSLGFNLSWYTTSNLPQLNFRQSYLARGPEIKLLTQHLKTAGIDIIAIVQRDSKQDLELYIKNPQGILGLTIPRKRLISPTTRIFVGWIFSVTICLVGLALWFLRNQIRSISRLAVTAEAFGKGQNVREFRLSGAKEVRQVGQAFFRMKRRIERQMQQRTELLAGVSHDLRTPLTRMRLILANTDNLELTEEMRREINEMDELISEYLAFARGEVRESHTQVNLTNLIKGLVSNLPYVDKITLKESLQYEPQISVRPRAINRAITNIIDNAARFANAIEITISDKVSKNHLAIIIDDNGPGVKPGDLNRIFDPFVSLPPAGYPQSVSTGLGLTIAKDIINNHGGEIETLSSPLGGARFTILLVK